MAKDSMKLIAMQSFQCRRSGGYRSTKISIPADEPAASAGQLFAESFWRELIAKGNSVRSGDRLVVEVADYRGLDPITVVCECRLSCQVAVVASDEIAAIKRDWPFEVGSSLSRE